MDRHPSNRERNATVASQIYFVKGVNWQNQHKFCEPLWLVSEARPEHIARRDFFWSGVVLYREKRWAEAYNEFQKVRDSETNEDLAVQFYLRKLEPLLLQLTGSAPE